MVFLASCVRNIPTKNYQNLIIGFQVTVENVGDVFGTQCIIISRQIVTEFVKNSINLLCF